MTNKRWNDLMEGDDAVGPHLTPEERELGWHFCQEFDGLLVGPGMGEIQNCTCLPKEKLEALIRELPADQLSPPDGMSDNSKTEDPAAVLVIARLEKECVELKRKIELARKLAQTHAGHKLMQVAGPFRELINLLK